MCNLDRMQNIIPSLEVETHLELHPPSRTIALFGLGASVLCIH
jgi:hypothetical protein